MKKGMGFICILLFTLLLSFNSIIAHQGTWTSKKGHDVNGVSTVSTEYAGGSDEAIKVTLIVKYGTGTNVGKKITGCAMGQKVSHTCWGEPFRDRYGVVEVPAAAYHTPEFED